MTIKRIGSGPGLPAGFPFSPASEENSIVHITGINEWWRRQFPDPATAPARLTFQAGALPFRAKVEFQAVAARRR
jgi:enamine deaminase RidA (YjgF/YER057c/UK114 family)